DETQSIFTGEYDSWVGKSVVSVDQFSPESLSLLFEVADRMRCFGPGAADGQRYRGSPPLTGCVLGTLFYESSTRTACSFQSAVLRLGGTFMNVGASTSSIKKGESLEDTVACLLSYCDALALRHPQKGAALRAAGVASRPVINAGDGVGEHPTQALLDLYTIQAEVG
ncbi:unnamed protein product, partial [Discosporangium mesarthrocarpum]